MSESGGCLVGEGLVVCAPRGNTYRTIAYCPTCKARRRFLVTLYVWYGPDASCCACGDSWGDGYRRLRPATRGWRARASRKLREEWRSTTTTKREALEWVYAEAMASLGEGSA